MTVLFVTQNGYGATRVRILHRSVGTLVGLVIAGVTLHLHIPESITLAVMLVLTLASYLIIRKNYGWATVGFTVTAVYTIQLLTLNGEQFIVPRLIDTLIGCLIAFGGMVWLWPQWQSGLLRKNAHDALEADQEAIRLILSNDPQATPLAYQRMRVNQAHNTLFNSLNQAMQEPGFNTHYLSDMKLWVTHSQFIVEHINAMTTLAREHTMLTPDLAQRYLESCEIAIQRCQQRLEYDRPGGSGDVNILESPDMPSHGLLSTLEQHLQRIIGHLNTMHTISSMAWRQRPHHGIWLSKRLRDTKVKTDRRMRYAYPAIRHQATTFPTACAKRCIPSWISASSTTSDGAKRITSAPALSTITPASAPAYRKSRARPLYFGFSSAPISSPMPRISLKMSNCSSIACKCCTNCCRLV